MEFKGFEQRDFDVLKIDGLEPRMKAIREIIQPKFQVISDELVDYLSMNIGNEMYTHIARHARRTVNPPDDTWVAFSSSKRGYKMLPHFQLGLWDDRLFVWLAYIYELPNKQIIADKLIKQQGQITAMIPSHYDISMNHMKKSNEKLQDINLDERLQRFKEVKSAELLIGRQFVASDPMLQNGDNFVEEVKSIYDKLIPLYQLSLQTE